MNQLSLPSILTKEALEFMTQECDRFVIRLHHEYKQYQQQAKTFIE
jgi:hypothetical protein